MNTLTTKKNRSTKNIRVVFVLFVLMTIAFFFSFATSSYAITITGSDTITTNSNATYTATGCSGSVSWSVTGTGASISSNGVLTTGSASCGGITVTARCSDGSIATKTVRVTDAGQWIQTSLCDHSMDWAKCLTVNGPLGGCCQTSGDGGTCYNIIQGKYRYNTFFVRVCQKNNQYPSCGYATCGHPCSPSLSSGECLARPTDSCTGSPNGCVSQEVAVICFYNKVEEWKCPPCTNGQTISCYTGTGGTQGVGICKAGTQTCTNGQWGACQGEITPVAEICGDGKDNNCDGNTDEGCIKLRITLNPDEIYPNEAGKPVSSVVTAEVTNSSGNYLSGYQVNFEAEVVESKGHDHTNTRSAGIIGGWCITDNSGKCTVNYYASTVAGIDKITASLSSKSDIKDSKEIKIKVPGLSPLGNAPNLITWTSTERYHSVANSNYGTAYTKGAVYYAVEKYAKDYGLNLSPDIYLAVIDMSLPWGGLFDINGDWSPPHSLHRRGESIDFSRYYKDSSGNNIEVVFYDEDGNVSEITGVIDDRTLDEKFSDKNFKCARLEKNIGKIHYECPK